MKLFYQTILFFISLYCLFSCKTAQVIKMQSNNAHIEDKVLVFENDSVKVIYDFWHNKGIVGFAIYNKLNIPIYVDWKRCSYIVNGKKLDYWADVEQTKTVAVYGGYSYRGPLLAPGYVANAGVGTSSSIKTKPEKITFIPPKSYIYRSDFLIVPSGEFDFKSNNVITTYLPISWKDNSSKTIGVKRLDYSKNSPFSIRNFLSLSVSEEFKSIFYVDNQFTVTEVLQMSEKQFMGKVVYIKGEKYFYSPYKAPNNFFIRDY